MTREVLLGAGVYQKIFPQARVLYEELPFLIASGHGCYRALVGSFPWTLKLQGGRQRCATVPKC